MFKDINPNNIYRVYKDSKNFIIYIKTLEGAGATSKRVFKSKEDLENAIRQLHFYCRAKNIDFTPIETTGEVK